MIKIIKNFFNLIESKTHFFLLSLSIFFGGILETLGISLTIPLLDLLIGNNHASIYSKYLNIISNHIEKDLITTVIIILLFFYSFRTIYLILLNYIQNMYLARNQNNIAKKIYSEYLNQPHEFHLNNNSSFAIRDLTNDVNAFLSLLQNLFIFFNDILFLFFIFIFMSYLASFKILPLFLILLLFSYFVLRFIKHTSTKWGIIKTSAEQSKIKIIQQGLGAIKEVKFLDKENFFLDLFSQAQKKISTVYFKQNFFQIFPKITIEYLSLFALLLYIFVNVKIYNTEVNEITSKIAIFFLVLVRVLPALIRLINSAQTIHFYNSSIDNLNKLYNLKYSLNYNKRSRKGFSWKLKKLPRSIIIKNLSFHYANSKKFIFENFSKKIFKNKLTLIYGPSGSGKSTLVDLLIGIIRPQKGGVWLDKKKNIFNSNNLLRKWQNSIGYVSQNFFILDDTILKNIAFGISNELIDIKKINKIIKIVKLDEFIKNNKDGFNTLIGENGARLSGGQKQRLGIARALYKEPKILILDETTNAIDPKTEYEIIMNLKNIKSINYIILISHKERIKNLCDSKIILNK
jgi:ABC-type multidrug transport system fused ATPase/permease subunit